MLRYDLSENKIYKANMEGETAHLGFILPIEDRENEFAVGIGNKVKIVRWDGKSTDAEVLHTQLELGPDAPTNNIHDGVVDPSGNLYAETVRSVLCNLNSTEQAGAVYRSSDGQNVERVISGLNAANGFAFDEYKNVFYLTDSCNKQIRVYDWDPDTSAICEYFCIKNIETYKLIIDYELFHHHIIDNGRILMDFKTNPGGKVPYAPDGLVLDTQGNIFSTINGAGYVYKIDPM